MGSSASKAARAYPTTRPGATQGAARHLPQATTKSSTTGHGRPVAAETRSEGRYDLLIPGAPLDLYCLQLSKRMEEIPSFSQTSAR